MKEFRITKARTVEVIRQYRGKPNGLHTELRNGDIDPDLPYTQTRDKDTGDYIYRQEEKPEVKEFEGEITDVEFEPKVKWTGNFTPPTEKYEPEPKKTVKPSKKKMPALISGFVGKKGKRGK